MLAVCNSLLMFTCEVLSFAMTVAAVKLARPELKGLGGFVPAWLEER